jgi:hypothetical protein
VKERLGVFVALLFMFLLLSVLGKKFGACELLFVSLFVALLLLTTVFSEIKFLENKNAVVYRTNNLLEEVTILKTLKTRINLLQVIF